MNLPEFVPPAWSTMALEEIDAGVAPQKPYVGLAPKFIY